MTFYPLYLGPRYLYPIVYFGLSLNPKSILGLCFQTQKIWVFVFFFWVMYTNALFWVMKKPKKICSVRYTAAVAYVPSSVCLLYFAYVYFECRYCIITLDMFQLIQHCITVLIIMFYESSPIFTRCYILRRFRLQTSTWATAFGISSI